MKSAKRKRLSKAGWHVGTTGEFLSLTPEEAAFVEIRLALSVQVKDARTRRGLTQAALARKLGSSQSRIAKAEAGDPTVSLDLLFRALIALGAVPRGVTGATASRKRESAA